MKKKKSLSYFIRFDQKSIQGRFTVLLLSVALQIVIMQSINYYLILQQDERNAYYSHTLLPSELALEEIQNTWGTDSASGKINQQIEKLNQLAPSWQENRLQAAYYSLLPILENTDNQSRKPAGLETMLQLIQEEKFRVQEEIAQFPAFIFRAMLIGFLIMFLIGIGIGFNLVRTVLNRIRYLRNVMRDMAIGYLPDQLKLSQDEMKGISEALNQLIINLRSVTEFARQVGKGDFEKELDAFEEESTLGESLSQMRDSLQQVAGEERTRRWFNEGLAEFAEIVRQHSQDRTALSAAVMNKLVELLQAQQGGIFLYDEENSTLELTACYAYERQKFLDRKLPAYDGLPGQALLEQKSIHLTEIPQHYQPVITGLSEGRVKSLLIVPLIHQEQAEGVLELASLHLYQPHEIELIEKLAESLAAALRSVKAAEETQQLLQESQSTAEQLRSQEEEMRQNTEELQATQEQMQRQVNEAQEQQQLLENMLNNLPQAIFRRSADQQATISFSNEAFNRLISADNKNMAWHELIQETDRERVKQQLEQQLQEGSTYTLNYKIKSSLGWMPVKESGSCQTDLNGNRYLDASLELEGQLQEKE